MVNEIPAVAVSVMSETNTARAKLRRRLTCTDQYVRWVEIHICGYKERTKYIPESRLNVVDIVASAKPVSGPLARTLIALSSTF